jgi:hypothetical protein
MNTDSALSTITRLWAGLPGNRHSIAGKGNKYFPRSKHPARLFFDLACYLKVFRGYWAQRVTPEV